MGTSKGEDEECEPGRAETCAYACVRGQHATRRLDVARGCMTRCRALAACALRRSAVTRNYSEKVINKILDLVSGSQNMELLQEFYETTLKALQEAKNDRLWCAAPARPCRQHRGLLRQWAAQTADATTPRRHDAMTPRRPRTGSRPT